MNTHPVFESWYVPGGPGSGIGSTLDYTALYREWLQRFLREENVRSVFDFGCGDWQFSRLLDWTGADYHGVDVVPSLVERLRTEYGGPGKFFSVVDPGNPEACMPGRADLFVAKDVFQHLPTDYLVWMLPMLRARFRLVLLVNDWSDREGWVNAEIRTGEYRPLDPAKPPFNLDVMLAFDFGTEFQKRAYLWRPKS